MAPGGLEKFVHSGQPLSSQRLISKKLVVDDSAVKGHRYASIEPFDQDSHRGAFSTDLESYPETSTNDSQRQTVATRQFRASDDLKQKNLLIGAAAAGAGIQKDTDTTISAQRSDYQGLVVATGNVSLPTKQSDLAALIGEVDTQEFREFDAVWERDQKEFAERAFEGPSMSALIRHLQQGKGQPMNLKSNAFLDQTSPNQATMTNAVRPAQISSTAGRPTAPTGNQSSNQAAPQVHHRFSVPQQKPRLNNVDAQQVTAASKANVNHKSVQTSLHQEQWKLKRRASLSDIHVGLSDADILATPYSKIEDDDNGIESKPAPAIQPSQLHQWIASITDNTFDEAATFASIMRLSDEGWVDFGDLLAAEHGQIINELKDLRNRKREVAATCEREIAQSMKQVQTNDGVVEGRLLRLRSYGAQMLNGGEGQIAVQKG